MVAARDAFLPIPGEPELAVDQLKQAIELGKRAGHMSVVGAATGGSLPTHTLDDGS